MTADGESPIHDTAPVRVWSVAEIEYANDQSTGNIQLGSFQFLAPWTFDQSFYRLVSETLVPGGFEELYRTPDGTAELTYREVLGQEPGSNWGDPRGSGTLDKPGSK